MRKRGPSATVGTACLCLPEGKKRRKKDGAGLLLIEEAAASPRPERGKKEGICWVWSVLF